MLLSLDTLDGLNRHHVALIVAGSVGNEDHDSANQTNDGQPPDVPDHCETEHGQQSTHVPTGSGVVRHVDRRVLGRSLVRSTVFLGFGERVDAVGFRQHGKVVERWWRRGRPFQRVGIPRVTVFAHVFRLVAVTHTDVQLDQLAGTSVGLTFVPHLVPMIRGMLSTIYVRILPEARDTDFQALFEKRYANEIFVDVMPPGSLPDTRSVRASNAPRIAIHRPGNGDRLVILVVQDNLVKGAAGQAIQNMNLMFGLPDSIGLQHVAILP